MEAVRRPNIKEILIGRALPTKDLAHQAVSRFIGLAVFASDALSSTAYATQEILIALSYATTAAMFASGGASSIFNLSIPIALAIAVLLVIVTVSYRQTIYAYPNGGGAYIVARDNLGELPAQIAGAALLTDYILTVAVSISSGVAQIVSAFPRLAEYRVEIALLVIMVMTVVNLRGVKESGRIFAVPTYFFLGSMFLMLGVGFIRAATGTLTPVEGVEMVHHGVVEPLGWFLILRAFSSGCTALTGIEAISNGITAFKEPKSHNAAVTLIWMSSILIVLFLGITFLASRVSVVPSEVETVISQMARSIYGGGFFYYLTLAGTALILLMAANTSYADFPRLAALHAGDGFLPRQLTMRGSRLVFSTGILTLGFFSALLVIFFRASTTALIPLYAIGVFLSFTMSQTGMVIRTIKASRMKPGEKIVTEATTLEYDPHWRQHIVISAVGAFVTGVVMMVFAVSKFSQGAWFIIVLIPLLVFAFFRIHYHYKDVAKELSASGKRYKTQRGTVLNLLFIEDVHAGTLRMVDYARSMGVPWQAVHVAIKPDKVEAIKRKWHERADPEGPEGDHLVIIESPYRRLVEPIREYVEDQLEKQPDGFINVMVGHLAMDSLWEQALHQNSALIFNLALQGLERVVFTTIPYQIHHLHHGEDDDHNRPTVAEVEEIVPIPASPMANALTPDSSPTMTGPSDPQPGTTTP